jgi:hypothetical protein
MTKKINTTTWLGIVAAGLTGAYLWKSAKDKGVNTLNHIEGINIEIKPDQLLDNAKKYIKTNPHARDLMANAAKGILNGYLSSVKSIKPEIYDEEE